MKNLKTLIAFVLAVSSCGLDAGRHDAWTQEEREALMRIVELKGADRWGVVAEVLNCTYGNGRTARECRNMANRNTYKNFTQEEDELILSKVNELGKKWTAIAKLLQDRRAASVCGRYAILSGKKKVGDCENGVCKNHKWTQDQRGALKRIVENNQGSTWKDVAEMFNSEFNLQMSSLACCGYANALGVKLNNHHKWTQVERDELKEIVESNQGSTWEKVAEIFNAKFKLQVSADACSVCASRINLSLIKMHEWTQGELDALKRIVEDNQWSTWENVVEIFNAEFNLQMSVAACKSCASRINLRLNKRHTWTQEQLDALRRIVEDNQGATWENVVEIFNSEFGLQLSVHSCRSAFCRIKCSE